VSLLTPLPFSPPQCFVVCLLSPAVYSLFTVSIQDCDPVAARVGFLVCAQTEGRGAPLYPSNVLSILKLFLPDPPVNKYPADHLSLPGP